MKSTLTRFIAILLLVIPGIAATYGFLVMKNVIFQYLSDLGNDHLATSAPVFGWLKFIGGLLLFAAGTGFIGGWIFFRDRKRNYVAVRFKKKKGPRPAGLGKASSNRTQLPNQASTLSSPPDHSEHNRSQSL